MEPTPSISASSSTEQTSLSPPPNEGQEATRATRFTFRSPPPNQEQVATRATRFTFSLEYDIIVLKEAVSINPFAAYGLRRWQMIVDIVARVKPCFLAARARTVRDRVLMLMKKYKADDMAYLRRSGTEEQYEEREMLLAELQAMMEEQSIVGRQRDSAVAYQGRVMREAAIRGPSQQSSSSISVKPEGVEEEASNGCSSSQADDMNYYDNDDRFTPANEINSEDDVTGASSQLNQSNSHPQSSGGFSGVGAIHKRLRNSDNKYLNASAETSSQNGVNSNTSDQPRVVRHSDVLLALKRKKLRVMEERLKVEKERLQVERGILQILKELKNKNGLPDSENL